MKSKFVLMRLFGASDPFKPITCMGGGGGGDTNSGGNDTLWNAQAEAAKQSTAMSGEMFDYWQKYSPTYLENASKMASEAETGALTERMRSKAGADASSALGQSLDAATRATDRYGAEFNPARMSKQANEAALQGAAIRSGAMNNANEWGENQKWARNQDAFGMTSGMPGNAVAAANSAGGNLSSMSSMQNSANNTAAQNAAGYGSMGATVASSMFKAEGGLIKANEFKMRCGGAVKRADGGAVRLAAGGIPSNPVVGWRERVAAMPTIGKTDNNSSPIANLVSGAAPTVATELAKPYLKEIGGSIKEGLGKTFGEARNGVERLAGVDQTQPAAQYVDKSTGLGMGTEAAGAEASTLVNPATGAADTAFTAAANADAATAGLATAAEADAAATTLASTGAEAAGGAMSALGTAMPWIGAGLALYSLFNDNADGGSIERKDMTPGGEVEGPGTETSDSIPAWLSDEEYVLNAEAVKMVGKDKLDAINEAGLKERHGDQAVMVDGEAKPNGLAGGGMLGIAMGAGAQTYNQLQAQKEQTRRADEQLQAQKEQQQVQNRFAESNLELAKEQSKRQGEVQGVQLEAAKYTLDEKKQIGSILGTAKDGLQKIRAGDYSPLGDRAKPDMKPEEAANMFEGMIGEQMKHASPEFFTAAQTANQKAQHDAMLARERQADRDSAERRHRESMNNAQVVAKMRSNGKADSDKPEKAPDFVKAGNDMKILSDDGTANSEIIRYASDFYNSAGGDGQRRVADSLSAGRVFHEARNALIAQAAKDNPDKPLTEDQINDKIAPYSLDPNTGAAIRKFTVNPADPSSRQYALSNTSNGGAPAVVREAIQGGLPKIISSIANGDLSDSDKEIWNKALVQKMTASGVSPADQAKVLQQWGADGLTQYVNKYLPKTAAPTKEGGKGGVSASKERTPEEEAAYGKRAETPFESIVSGVKSIAGKIGESDKAMVEKAEKQKFYGLKNMIQRRGLTDGEVKQYKELLSKYPELAEKTNVAAN